VHSTLQHENPARLVKVALRATFTSLAGLFVTRKLLKALLCEAFKSFLGVLTL